MSSQPIRTTAELHDPWVFVEVVDGRVATLQFDRALLGRDHESELAEAITRAANEALQQQAAELLAPTDEADADRDRVLAFAERAFAEPPKPAGARPEAASRGIEAHETRANVVDGLIEALWIDAALLDRGQPFEAEQAVRAALNDALERYESSEGALAVDLEAAPTSPTWASLAAHIDRIERGLL